MKYILLLCLLFPLLSVALDIDQPVVVVDETGEVIESFTEMPDRYGTVVNYREAEYRWESDGFRQGELATFEVTQVTDENGMFGPATKVRLYGTNIVFKPQYSCSMGVCLTPTVLMSEPDEVSYEPGLTNIQYFLEWVVKE